MLNASISANTSDSYKSAINVFDRFRSVHGHDLNWPPQIDVILDFISYLSVQGYAPSTAKSYIFGISFQCKLLNVNDVSQNFVVKKMLLGMERLDKRVDSRLPITPDLLEKIVKILPAVSSSQYETILFSALFSIAYFGFFRIGELVVNKSLAHSHTILIDDIVIQDKRVLINLKFSKTDQLGKGTIIDLQATDSFICPFKLLKRYLDIRPQNYGPAFIHFGGSPVTVYQFNAVLQKALGAAKVSSNHLRGHSFRVGAASQSSKLGFSDEEVQEFGRWESKAYKSYIRIPTVQLAKSDVFQ